MKTSPRPVYVPRLAESPRGISVAVAYGHEIVTALLDCPDRAATLTDSASDDLDAVALDELTAYLSRRGIVRDRNIYGYLAFVKKS